MKETTRRLFVLQVAAGGALLATASANAQTAAKVDPKAAAAPVGDMLDPKSPAAVGLNYVEDTKKVDKVKFPKHEATQVCSNCQLYAGKAGDKAAGCPIFPGKKVTSAGWCSAYVKKAA